MAYDDTKSSNDEIKSSEYNNLIADLKGRVNGTSVNEAIADTSANRPTAGTSGRLFFETDTGRVLYDNGTSWVEVGLSESEIEADALGGANGTAGQVLQTDGSAASWVSLIDGGGKVFVQDTEPTATQTGDVWIASGGDL